MCVLEPCLSPSLIKKEASAKAFADLTEEKRAHQNETKCASRQNKIKPKEENQQNKIEHEEENDSKHNKNCKIKIRNEKENQQKKKPCSSG
jgi:hypothetical protein